MAWRPEYGWRRLIWRTAFAVSATVLLTVSAARAQGGTGDAGGTPQAPTGSSVSESSGEPDPDQGPSGIPSDSVTPGAEDPATGDPPESPGTARSPIAPSPTTGPPRADPAPSGGGCESGNDCVQTEEDVDICETGDAACDADGEDETATGLPGDQDGP